MTSALHPLAPHELPRYLAGADGHDPLFAVIAGLLVILLMVAGNLYFKLHAYPERLGHGRNHTQMQMIAVLTILALFTHNNIFWVAALLLSAVSLPDFSTPINSMADSLKTLAKSSEDTDHAEVPAARDNNLPPEISTQEEV
jgi:hypothetical protein